VSGFLYAAGYESGLPERRICDEIGVRLVRLFLKNLQVSIFFADN
jgi:hypothetical protein